MPLGMRPKSQEFLLLRVYVVVPSLEDHERMDRISSSDAFHASILSQQGRQSMVNRSYSPFELCYDAIQVSANGNVLSIVPHELNNCAVLGLLYRILPKIRVGGASNGGDAWAEYVREHQRELFGEEQIDSCVPETPDMKYSERARRLASTSEGGSLYAKRALALCWYEPDLQMYINAFHSEFGARVRECGKTIIVEFPDMPIHSIASCLQLAADSYVRRQFHLYDWTLSTIGSLVSLPALLVAALDAIQLEQTALDSAADVSPFLLLGVLTCYAPYRLGRLVMNSLMPARQLPNCD